MSKHLVDPTAATPSGPKKPRPHARLLTSADSLQEMKEKEHKKKEEMEEKERVRRKKKQREEEQKRKPAERTKRTEEKAKKVEEKAKKAAAAKRLPKRKPVGESSTATRSKKSRVDNMSGGEIDPNIC